MTTIEKALNAVATMGQDNLVLRTRDIHAAMKYFVQSIALCEKGEGVSAKTFDTLIDDAQSLLARCGEGK